MHSDSIAFKGRFLRTKLPGICTDRAEPIGGGLPGSTEAFLLLAFG